MIIEDVQLTLDAAFIVSEFKNSIPIRQCVTDGWSYLLGIP